jgi:hypothetical protein
MKNHYQILGVPHDASREDIKRAYYILAGQFHPDKDNGSEERFKEIVEAYRILSHESTRAEYDAKLSANQTENKQKTETVWQKVEKPQSPIKALLIASVPILLLLFVTYLIIMSLKGEEAGNIPASQAPPPVDSPGEIDSPPRLPQLPEKAEEISIGSAGVIAKSIPVQFSGLSMYSYGHTITNDFDYTRYQPASTPAQYIRVTFVTNNLSKTEKVIELSRFQLKDQQDRTYYPERAYNCDGKLTLGPLSHSSVNLKPSVPCDWSMLYKVAKDSSSFTLLLDMKPCTEFSCALTASEKSR